jgi:hypothetical protein
MKMLNNKAQEAITKKTRGGARVGAGRKPKYGEPTTNITIRVPISHKNIIYKMVAEYLKTVTPKTK